MKHLPIILTVLTLALWFSPTVIPAEAPAKPAPVRPLTLQQLASLFKQLDHDVKPYENAQGRHIGFQGTIEFDKRPFAFKALLTGDGSTVWLTVRVAKVEDIEGVPAEIFLKLLAANRRIAPAFFAYADDDCGLYLYLPAFALGLTAVGLEQQMNLLVHNLGETYRFWNTEGWFVKPSPTPSPKK